MLHTYVHTQIDRQEAELRAEQRRIQIERANKMLFDETDRVKGFHSKMLLSDVMKENEQLQVRTPNGPDVQWSSNGKTPPHATECTGWLVGLVPCWNLAMRPHQHITARCAPCAD